MLIWRTRGLTRLTISHGKLSQYISSIFSPMHKETRGSIINLKTKKEVKNTKILKIKCRTELMNNGGSKCRMISCDNYVINID